MSQIRRKSIKGTIWIYLGFLVGAINIYLFTHKNFFNLYEFGLTTSLRDIALLVGAMSAFGTTTYLVKFFPYYEDNTTDSENDMLSIALRYALLGFIVTALVLFLMQDLVIRKFGTNSPLLVEYFYYAVPMGFFITLYNLLEAYSYGYGKTVLTNFLKEFALRLYTLIVILIKILGLINFKTFVVLFILQYAFIALTLGFILLKEGRLHLIFTKSRVTKKFRKKIKMLMVFSSFVVIVGFLRSTIDTLVLASRLNLDKTAIFSFSSFLVSVMQAPFRSVVSVTTPILSRAWKDKDYKSIQRIYKSSSINLLSFALFIFGCILLNFETAIHTFGLSNELLDGKPIVILLGLVTIIEVGTGVNGQIIGSSIYWRFELWTSLILTSLLIPLSYFFTVKYGLIGPSLAGLVSFTIYNAIRFSFLWKKYRMQPFSQKTLEVILLSVFAFIVAWFSTNQISGILHIIASTALYLLIFLITFYKRNLSPDFKPVLFSILNRFKKSI